MRIRSSRAERGVDLYETPEVATLALLRAEKLPHYVWEPCCGPGAIARVLRRHRHTVIASDLVDYGSRDQDSSGRDFLLEQRAPERTQCIVTNPPYRLATEFAAHAIKLCPFVALLLRVNFLASRRRTALLESGHFARVHIFRGRLPMMHRADWTGPRASSATDYGWFVWSRDHEGPATINRISWTTE